MKVAAENALHVEMQAIKHRLDDELNLHSQNGKIQQPSK